MIELLSVDRINGTRINCARAKTKPIKADQLEKIYHRELKKLKSKHKEMDEEQQKKELDVNFQYRDLDDWNPHPDFRPRPECECGSDKVEVNKSNGILRCLKCEREWYDETYSMKAYNERNANSKAQG